MSRWTALLVVACACSGGQGQQEGTTTTPTGGDTDIPCSSLAPVDQVGRQLVWLAGVDGGYPGTVIETVVGLEDHHGQQAYRVDLESAIQLPNTLLRSSASSWYRCDSQGVWLLGQVITSTFGETDTTSSAQRLELVFTVPPLVAPPSVAAGDTWDYDAVAETRLDGGPTDTIEVFSVYEVDELETITVGAGTFDAWPIRYHEGAVEQVRYVVEGLGPVKDGTTELVEIRE